MTAIMLRWGWIGGTLAVILLGYLRDAMGIGLRLMH
jgi:hypothetical protein